MTSSSSTPKTGRIRRHYYRFRFCCFEALEVRQVLSASAASSILKALAANLSFDPMFIPSAPQQTAGPSGMTPAQIRHAYGFDNISFNGKNADGKGITIAIVDAGNSPTIVSDLHAFDLAFGLPDPPSFKIVNQNGSSNPAFLPPDDQFTSVETALDVEWAHAVAPGANILLVESDDILGAVNYARHVPNVAVVSISYSIGSRVLVPGTNSLTEFIGQTSGDFVFTTPTGHQGISFTVSAGDAGGPAQWPSSSPNVLSVGGTKLTLTKTGNYQSEVVWNEGINGGSGGGGLSGVVFTDGVGGIQVSNNAPLGLERAPSYQSALGFTTRATPDVSFNADPVSGYPVYDSFAFGAATPWDVIGGTSAAAPIWAGLIAIADQGRKLLGKSSLGNVQSVIYKLPASDFHDITVGNNDMFGFGLGISGNASKPGYDLASGRGTPIANLVIRDLVAFNGSTSFTVPSSAFANINVIPTRIFFASNLTGAFSSSTSSLMNVSQSLNSASDDSADLHALAIQNVDALAPQNDEPVRPASLSLAFESHDDEPIWKSDHHVILDPNAAADTYAELDTFFEKV